MKQSFSYLKSFRASEELDEIVESTETEKEHRDAELRMAKTKLSSLQAQLDQKSHENEELVAICDQLIGRN